MTHLEREDLLREAEKNIKSAARYIKVAVVISCLSILLTLINFWIRGLP